jgi:hypothetical protein
MQVPVSGHSRDAEPDTSVRDEGAVDPYEGIKVPNSPRGIPLDILIKVHSDLILREHIEIPLQLLGIEPVIDVMIVGPPIFLDPLILQVERS